MKQYDDVRAVNPIKGVDFDTSNGYIVLVHRSGDVTVEFVDKEGCYLGTVTADPSNFEVITKQSYKVLPRRVYKKNQSGELELVSSKDYIGLKIIVYMNWQPCSHKFFTFNESICICSICGRIIETKGYGRSWELLD